VIVIGFWHQKDAKEIFAAESKPIAGRRNATASDRDRGRDRDRLLAPKGRKGDIRNRIEADRRQTKRHRKRS